MKLFTLSSNKYFFVFVLSFGLFPLTKAQTLDWAKSLSGSGGEKALGISAEVNGSVYSTGWFNLTADFDPGTGVFNLTAANSSDIYVSKLSSSGDFVWAKSYGGSGADQGTAIFASTSGNILATGFFLVTADFNPGQPGSVLASFGDFDGYVLKLDSLGNLLWVKHIGGPGLEQMESITEDASGNVYVTGSFTDTCDFDPDTSVFNLSSTGGNGSDAFLLKLDGDGNFIWAKQFGGSASEIGISVKTDSFGYLYLSGSFRLTSEFNFGGSSVTMTSLGSDDVFLCKFDTSGQMIYTKSYGGPNADNITDMVIDENSNVYCSGFFLGDVDFDPGPNAYMLHSDSVLDSYVCKFDSTEQLVWAKQFDGDKAQLSTSISLDVMGNVYTGGWFNDTVDFDPGVTAFPLISNGSSDFFICKLNNSGDFLWAHNTGSADFDQITSLDIKNSKLYITGEYRNSVDFDFFAGVSLLSVVQDRDAFVAQYDLNLSTGLPLMESDASDFVISPNPGIQNLLVSSNKNAQVLFYNLSGQLISTELIIPGTNKINVEELPVSIYILKIINSKEQKLFKWIKTEN